MTLIHNHTNLYLLHATKKNVPPPMEKLFSATLPQNMVSIEGQASLTLEGSPFDLNVFPIAS
jgi:hypothetical protein